MSSFPMLAARQARRDDDQIVRNHAPAEPALQADLAPVAAAVQLAGAPQLTDAAFDARSKAQRGSKPGLRFVFGSRLILMPGLRQRDILNSGGPRQLLVG